MTKTGGTNPSVSDWYAFFLRNAVIPHAAFWAYVITFGEVLVGVGLILDALTGIAAFFGLVMNVNYLLAGTVSTNPILAVLAALLMLAWRVASYYGLDRYLLPLLGTSWTGPLRGPLAHPDRHEPEPPPEQREQREPAGAAHM